MFSGRGFNIETLNVGPMPDDRFSRITATILCDSDALDQAIKQVYKLVNVIEVTEFSSGQATERELIILKVKLRLANDLKLCRSVIFSAPRSLMWRPKR